MISVGSEPDESPLHKDDRRQPSANTHTKGLLRAFFFFAFSLIDNLPLAWPSLF